MKRLIFQVDVGKPSDLTSLRGGASKLYEFCQESVSKYCEKYGIDHYVLTEPVLKIKPDEGKSQRSEGALRLGYLPIYEKEHAFTFFDDYDQIAVVDSDIYIRDTAPNIFEEFDPEADFGGVVEREMPCTDTYYNKIRGYSHGQYSSLPTDHRPNQYGYEFFNMGLMVMNKSIVKYLHGLSPREFISQPKFKPFVEGHGAWRWSTDQTLLNYWVRAEGMKLDRMSWKWNGLFKGIKDEAFKDAHFLHFFLKTHLPNAGEDTEMLQKIVDGDLNLNYQHR